MDTTQMRAIAPTLTGEEAVWLIAYCGAVEAGVQVTPEAVAEAERLCAE